MTGHAQDPPASLGDVSRLPAAEGPGGGDASVPPDSTPFPGRAGITRRDFLKAMIASGVAAGGATYFGSACARPLPATGGGARLLTLSINGRSRRVDALPQETLAMTLRYRLGLTGTKLACDRADCGACTVMLDGVAHYACSILTHRVRGREVTTVEGLVGPSGELHPVQQGFIEELAPQCGFCTPGQVVAAAALLRENPEPTREEARRALAGNLCRCGAYDHYLNGVMRAAEIQRGPVAARPRPGASGPGNFEASSADLPRPTSGEA